MNPRFLSSKVRKYICPYCGQWHRDIAHTRLDLVFPPLSCPDVPYKAGYIPQYSFNFSGSEYSYSIKNICSNVPPLSGTIPINKFREISSKGENYIASVIILFLNDMPEDACNECKFAKDCVYRRLAEQAKYREIAIKVGFAFSLEDFERITSNI